MKHVVPLAVAGALSLLLIHSLVVATAPGNGGSGICAPFHNETRLYFPTVQGTEELNCQAYASNTTVYDFHHGVLDQVIFGTPNVSFAGQRALLFAAVQATPARAVILPPRLSPPIRNDEHPGTDVFFLCPGKLYGVQGLTRVSYLGPIYPDTLPGVFSSADIQAACGEVVTSRTRDLWPAFDGVSVRRTENTTTIPMACLVEHTIVVRLGLVVNDPPYSTGPVLFWYHDVLFLDVQFQSMSFVHLRLTDCSFEGTIGGRLIFSRAGSLMMTRCIITERVEGGVLFWAGQTGRYLNATEATAYHRQWGSTQVIFDDMLMGMIWMENITLFNVPSGLLVLLSDDTFPTEILGEQRRATGFLWNGDIEIRGLHAHNASTALAILSDISEVIRCARRLVLRGLKMMARENTTVIPIVMHYLSRRRVEIVLLDVEVHLPLLSEIPAVLLDLTSSAALGRDGVLVLQGIGVVGAMSRLSAVMVAPYPSQAVTCLEGLPAGVFSQVLLISYDQVRNLSALYKDQIFGADNSLYPVRRIQLSDRIHFWQPRDFLAWFQERRASLVPAPFQLLIGSSLPRANTTTPWVHLSNIPLPFPNSTVSVSVHQTDVLPDKPLLRDQIAQGVVDSSLSFANGLYWSEGWSTDWHNAMQPMLCLENVHLSPWNEDSPLAPSEDRFTTPAPWNQTLCDFLHSNGTREIPGAFCNGTWVTLNGTQVCQPNSTIVLCNGTRTTLNGTQVCQPNSTLVPCNGTWVTLNGTQVCQPNSTLVPCNGTWVTLNGTQVCQPNSTIVPCNGTWVTLNGTQVCRPNSTLVPCNGTWVTLNGTQVCRPNSTLVPCNGTWVTLNGTQVCQPNSTVPVPCPQLTIARDVFVHDVVDSATTRWLYSQHFPSVFQSTIYQFRLNCSLLSRLTNDTGSVWITQTCPTLSWKTGEDWFHATSLHWKTPLHPCGNVSFHVSLQHPNNMQLLVGQAQWQSSHLDSPWYQGQQNLCLHCNNRDATAASIEFQYTGTQFPPHTVLALPSWPAPCLQNRTCYHLALSSDLRRAAWSPNDTSTNYRVRVTFQPSFVELPALVSPLVRVSIPPPLPPPTPDPGDPDPDPGDPAPDPGDPGPDPLPPAPAVPSTNHTQETGGAGGGGTSATIFIVIGSGVGCLALIVVVLLWWRSKACAKNERTGQQAQVSISAVRLCELHSSRYSNNDTSPSDDDAVAPFLKPPGAHFPPLSSQDLGRLRTEVFTLRKERLASLEPHHKLFFRRTSAIPGE